MFEWHKKEKPILGVSGFGGGAGGLSFGGGPLIIQATGGSAGGGSGITPGDGYRYFIFTSPGPNPWVVTQGAEEVEYIIIAGGGGGSNGTYGSGGGAGGMLKLWPAPLFTGPATGRNVAPPFPVAPGTYDITVGAGAPRTPAYPNPSIFINDGLTGGNSIISGPTITTITVYGGGGGNDPQGGAGNPGGSGGGAGEPYVSKPAGNGYNYPGTTQQGFPGGNGQPPQGAPAPAPTQYSGGGGGSAFRGGEGWNGPYPTTDVPGLSRAGDGDGFGGIPPSYGTPGPNPTFRYFAGGGSATAPGVSIPGGIGGGGNGGRASVTVGTAGQTNTGGGGGGGSYNSVGGKETGHGGGSGIIIIRCLAG